MLQTQTVSAELLELLKSFMQIEDLKTLRLVGGTALALQIGHRTSIDIDLFGELDLNEFDFQKFLSQYGSYQSLGGSKSIKVFLVNGIKVDFVNYPYEWIAPALDINGVRLASKKDIAAMKVAAITQRGSKKDFIDIFFLLEEFSLEDIFSFYKEKMPDSNPWLALRSMVYFEDADKEPMPLMQRQISWPEVKKTIQKEVVRYQKKLK